MISRRKFLFYIIGAFGISFFGYGFYEKKKYKIENLFVPIKKWIGNPIRIVFLTDLHRGPFTGISFLKNISDEVKKLKPDILIFGGDYIYASNNYLKDALSPFKEINPLLGKWGVLGNHDNFLGRKKVIKSLNENDVYLLNNESFKIIHGEKKIYLFGVDDLKTGNPDLNKGSKFIKDDGTIIGISHNPLFWEKVKFKTKPDLLLSGHTHGGQIDLPFLGPIFLFPSHGKKYYRGLYNLDGIKLYVSRGIGTIHIPLRIFCPPEITVINISGNRF